MKEAAIRDLAGDLRHWVESSLSCGLRVDVEYRRKQRAYLVECETNPSIPRLIKKGINRNKSHMRNVYILVVTESDYLRLEWKRLRGYFDIIMAYDDKLDSLTISRDLRFMGGPRDTVLDTVLPIVKSKKFTKTMDHLSKRKNRFKWALRTFIQCNACRLGVDTPWYFCPKYDCEKSGRYSTESYHEHSERWKKWRR
jgi:hypothetical protein